MTIDASAAMGETQPFWGKHCYLLLSRYYYLGTTMYVLLCTTMYVLLSTTIYYYLERSSLSVWHYFIEGRFLRDCLSLSHCCHSGPRGMRNASFGASPKPGVRRMRQRKAHAQSHPAQLLICSDAEKGDRFVSSRRRWREEVGYCCASGRPG